MTRSGEITYRVIAQCRLASNKELYDEIVSKVSSVVLVTYKDDSMSRHLSRELERIVTIWRSLVETCHPDKKHQSDLPVVLTYHRHTPQFHAAVRPQ